MLHWAGVCASPYARASIGFLPESFSCSPGEIKCAERSHTNLWFHETPLGSDSPEPAVTGRREGQMSRRGLRSECCLAFGNPLAGDLF